MPGKRILILGGTGEAREIAAILLDKGFDVISSLAGVTAEPVLPAGALRRGGFGGAAGLASYLREEGIAAVVDATHPFAARMSGNAAIACQEAGLPLLRFERPPWQPQPGDRWTTVATVGDAAAALPAGARALVTIGRKEIAPFLSREDVSGIVRMIEAPDAAVPPNWTALLERPPFTLQSERRLMADHGITALVTKNAGGVATEAKLEAARELAIPVILVARPAKQAGGCFASVHELTADLERSLSP
jgi:precorrin-6A/cobalt-precorrin-6A reductase